MSDEVPKELYERAIALARKKYSDQPPGFPFSEFDWNGVRLPQDMEKEIREEIEDEGYEALADLTEETGFESVIGNSVL